VGPRCQASRGVRLLRVSFLSLWSPRFPHHAGAGSQSVWRLPMPGPGRPFQLLSVADPPLGSGTKCSMRCERLRQDSRSGPIYGNGSEAEPSPGPGTLHQFFSLRANQPQGGEISTSFSLPDYFVFSTAPSGITP
jgi:hypothetical protein